MSVVHRGGKGPRGNAKDILHRNPKNSIVESLASRNQVESVFTRTKVGG